MRPRELLALVGGRRPVGSVIDRRLARCHDIHDLRRAAMRRVPRPVFDYVDGGADEERSLVWNADAFDAYELRPRLLRDVSALDTSTTLLGARLALPLVLAPTGYSRMLEPDGGECAVARAAGRHGVPYTLSTVASSSIAKVAAAAPDAERWFQLYVWRDRDLVARLVAQAAEHGNRVLEITLDVPVPGFRRRDVRNGLTIPPRLTPRAILSVAAKPGYWWRLARSPAITFANAPAADGREAVTIQTMGRQFDPSVGWDELAEFRRMWPGRLTVKGPLGVADAERAVAAGVDALHLSNHGGRQMDRIRPPLDAVADIRAAVGPGVPIIVDSGITSGADLAVALALGADAGAIGKAYLYGLMAGGERGVDHALTLLAGQFARTMALLGVRSVTELRDAGTELVARRPGR